MQCVTVWAHEQVILNWFRDPLMDYGTSSGGVSVPWSRGIRHQEHACYLLKIQRENGQKTSEKFGIFSFIWRIVMIGKSMDLHKSTGFFPETLPLNGIEYAWWSDALWRRLTGLFGGYHAKLISDWLRKKCIYLMINTTYEQSSV